jgi:hypothetical protein
MSSIANFPIPEHDMELPKGQTVILDWNGGPLPDQHLEQIALKVFRRQYPMAAWTDPTFKSERDDARRFAMQLRVDYLKLDRWTLANCVEKLTDESCQLVYGDRRLGSTIRNQVKDFAESYIEDLAKLFPMKLFYPQQVSANAVELKHEDEINGNR